MLRNHQIGGVLQTAWSLEKLQNEKNENEGYKIIFCLELNSEIKQLELDAMATRHVYQHV